MESNQFIEKANKIIVSEVTLRKIVEELLNYYGLPIKQAKVGADLLVKADLRGVHSHGVRRLLKFYIPLLKNKTINNFTEPNLIQKSANFAMVDGSGKFGPYVGYKSMNRCIEIAKQRGLAAISVKKNTHFGFASYYTLMAVRHVAN